MTKFSFTFALGVIFSAQFVFAAVSGDSIRNKEIEEVTVFGGLSKFLSLPMVVVDKKTIEASSFFFTG